MSRLGRSGIGEDGSDVFLEVLKKGASERKKLDVHHVGDGLRFTEMNLLLDENRPLFSLVCAGRDIRLALRPAPHPNPLPGGEREMYAVAKTQREHAALRLCAFALAFDLALDLQPPWRGGEGWTIRPRRGRGQESSPF